ncbi:pca operon transcription factor PcaQ [Aurantimonas sp. MSK8Z-1]|uniref:pca operon transcription factor PcaQ n=1 Tax=Mangrovibrevibacter kandeliae TaxID=2968473 RepID=UPI0021191BC8|nr:pca operon transcription factor PcaQ [Aurantimonas sp. MSK8Z-1]MCW4116132.1 pca operon transcription factor PcaQ [Aurantimonas sp. MSK8Z-1]
MYLDPRIKLRHLQTFAEVARLRSVGRAAERLAVSQPAVSKTLAELETILGASLMVRNRGGAVPTPIGQLFLTHAEASLAMLRHGVEAVAEGLAQTAVRLAIGCLPSVAARIVPDAAIVFAGLAPGATLSIVSGPNAFLLSELASGALDLVIGRMGPAEAMTRFSFSQLYSERIALVVRPGHPLEHETDAAAIADFPLLFPDENAAIRSIAEQFFVARGLRRRSERIETVADSFGRSFVRKTDAIWVISSGVVALDVAEGRLCELPIDMAGTSGPVGLTMRAEGEIPPVLRLFIQAVRDTVGRLALTDGRS